MLCILTVTNSSSLREQCKKYSMDEEGPDVFYSFQQFKIDWARLLNICLWWALKVTALKPAKIDR